MSSGRKPVGAVEASGGDEVASGGGSPAEQGELGMEADGEAEQEELAVNLQGVDGATSATEFNKVLGNLKTSLEDLQNVVEDPLPNAKIAADRVIANRPKQVMHLEEPNKNLTLDSRGNQNPRDVGTPLDSTDKEVIHTDGIKLNMNANKVSRPGLMHRNPTARTYEWEDESLDSASDDLSSPSKKIYLSSPSRSRGSPLKPPPHFQKIPRKRKRWSAEEEDTLREAVNKHGKGHWKIILDEYREHFEERTVLDLKDKWRNMTR